MRIISTLCLLVIAATCYAQTADTEKVVVFGNCWGKPKPVDTHNKISVADSNKATTSFSGQVSLQNGLTGKVAGLNVQTTSQGVSTTKYSFHCERTLTGDDQPLLVVDGVLVELSQLSTINPSTIASIEIIKDASATAMYGCRAANGVLILTTIRSTYRKFFIKDLLDNSPVAGATVTFLSGNKKDTLYLVANDSGIVQTNKLKPAAKYDVQVSAVGHKATAFFFTNTYGYKEQDFLLPKEVKICEGVVISSTVDYRKVCRYRRVCRCGTIGTRRSIFPDYSFGVSDFRVFPNPAVKGTAVTINFNADASQQLSVKVFNLSGQLVKTMMVAATKNNNQVSISTDANWASGTYILQLLYENGRVAASGKIIIQ